jgi:hypothetical protein
MTAPPILLGRVSLVLAAISTASAAPGRLDPAFKPDLIQEASPLPALLTEHGNLLLGGFSPSGMLFDHLSGSSVGSRCLVGPDGQPAGEPLPGFLDDTGFAPGLSVASSSGPAWFPLEEGRWLVRDQVGSWDFLNSSTKAITTAFPDLQTGESISPQFFRDGFLWVVLTRRDGTRALQKRRSADGSIDPAFIPASGWPADPLQAVPAPGGKLWILAGSLPQFGGLPSIGGDAEDVVFRVDSTGKQDDSITPFSYDHQRQPELHQAANGGFTIALSESAFFWPIGLGSLSQRHSIEQFDASARPGLTKDFSYPLGSPFAWAEDDQRHLLVASGNGALTRYLADGSSDPSFQSPAQGVRSLISLPDGKWLINGTQRLLRDGGLDPAWQKPDAEAPGAVSLLVRLPDGRVLTGGAFSRVGGQTAGPLCLLRADGSLDPSFHADARVTRPLSIAVSGNWIYVVNASNVPFEASSYGNLVRINFSGQLDESYHPGTSSIYSAGTLIYASQFSRVAAAADGGILAVGESFSDIPTSSLLRMDRDGRVVQVIAGGLSPAVRANGEFVAGRNWYAASGTLLRKVGGVPELAPVCEWQGGMLFAESIQGQPGGPGMNRLRLWRNGRWDAGFAASPVRADEAIRATPGDAGSLYISAGWNDGTATLRRMGPSGKFAPTFLPPAFTSRIRREAGPWLTLQNGVATPFNPASTEQTATPATMIYHPESKRLWVGGSFNRAGNQNQNGLAWLDTGGLLPAAPQSSAWKAWLLGMGIDNDPKGSADPDGDGIPNALEFIFGTDPRLPSGGPSISTVDQNAVYEYTVCDEAKDYAVVAEFSEDLSHWTTATTANATISSEPADGDLTRYRITLPRTGRDRTFFRVRATLP